MLKSVDITLDVPICTCYTDEKYISEPFIYDWSINWTDDNKINLYITCKFCKASFSVKSFGARVMCSDVKRKYIPGNKVSDTEPKKDVKVELPENVIVFDPNRKRKL